jgi:hypothetical protein
MSMGGSGHRSVAASGGPTARDRAIVAREATARERDALAFWLGTKRKVGFAQLRGGIGRHIRDGRRQNVAGIADVLMWLPKADGTALRVALELKIGRDSLSGIQREVLDWERDSGALVLVCRYGTVRPGEVDQDTAVRIIEEALAP